jgi:uncharacterized protein (TIGR02996 family)
MSQEDAFLQAILQDPDDVALRLVYADWLEERGDPKGEFIRLQCDAEQVADDELRAARLARAGALQAAHEAEWLGRLRGRVQGWTFRRGFIEDVTLGAAAFLDHADELFAASPIRRVRLRDAHTVVERLALCPHLARLVGLDLSDNRLGDAEAEVLAESPYLDSLQSLDLALNGIGLSGARALARGEHWGRLRELRLAHNHIADLGAYALAASSGFPSLTTLDLSFCGIGPPGVKDLAGSRHLAGLEVLDLSSNAIGDAGVRALAASRHLTGLSVLRLRANGIGGLGAWALIEATAAFPNLTLLDLSDNAIASGQQNALRERFGDAVCRF